LTTKLGTFLIAASLVVPLDQLTKAWVIREIQYGGEIPVIDGFFSITHVQNSGIVFGLFQDGYIWLFLLLTLLAIGLIAVFFRQLDASDRLAGAALGMILGGAIGNGIDRVIHEAVIDFLHFDFGWFVYPDFNVADSGIVIGVGLLLIAPPRHGESPSDSEGARPAALGGDSA